MSGGFIPYHLRPNKAVDRQLFVELLAKVNRFKPIGQYTYIGFGGSFLEDFKLIHTYFGNKKMISIEEDLNVLKRQKFNLPLRCITRRHEKSGDFIASYPIRGSAMIWLDYANPRQLRVQIEEYEALISKLQLHDIIRITLNASPDTLRGRDSVDEKEKRETADVRNAKRLKKLTDQLGDYLPQDTDATMMTVDELPQVYCRVLEFAANKASQGRSSEMVQPLSAFVYADSAHQMLTLTGIIIEKKEVTEFFRKTAIKRWRHASVDWKTFRVIRVPELTAREKLFIDRYLPSSKQKGIHKRLDFLFAEDEVTSLEILKSYTDYYRYYPSYHRVTY